MASHGSGAGQGGPMAAGPGPVGSSSGLVTPMENWSQPLPQWYTSPVEVWQGMGIIESRLEQVKVKLDAIISASTGLEQIVNAEKAAVRTEISSMQGAIETKITEHTGELSKQVAAIQATQDVVGKLANETKQALEAAQKKLEGESSDIRDKGDQAVAGIIGRMSAAENRMGVAENEVAKMLQWKGLHEANALSNQQMSIHNDDAIKKLYARIAALESGQSTGAGLTRGPGHSWKQTHTGQQGASGVKDTGE